MARSADVSPLPGVPVRTCVGCRRRAARDELVRVVLAGPGPDLRVVLDPGRRASGRGANLHPTSECLDLALRRRALGRALRVTGRLDTGELAVHVARVEHTPPGA